MILYGYEWKRGLTIVSATCLNRVLQQKWMKKPVTINKTTAPFKRETIVSLVYYSFVFKVNS